MDFLKTYKKDIDAYLESYLKHKIKETPKIQKLQNELIRSLLEFSLRGKSVRGSLLLYTYVVLGGKKYTEAIKVASALELFHSSMLIHDDVIDNDTIRRNHPSIWHYYKEEIGSQEYGKSIAICIGDMGFFLGFEILSQLNFPPNSNIDIIKLFSKELNLVGLAEAYDIHYGYTNQFPSKETIELIYTYKTARYTFSIPFIAACILTDNKKLSRKLEQLGETTGLLYQLKDDELGLIGNPEKTGKPIGNDIIEKKKTFILSELINSLTYEEKNQIEILFQKKRFLRRDLAKIMDLIHKYNIIKKVKEKQKKLMKRTQTNINALPLSSEVKNEYLELVDFCYNRER